GGELGGPESGHEARQRGRPVAVERAERVGREERGGGAEQQHAVPGPHAPDVTRRRTRPVPQRSVGCLSRARALGSKTARPSHRPESPTTKEPSPMATLLMVESWINSTGRSLPPLLRDLGHDYVLLTRDPGLYPSSSAGTPHPAVAGADEVVVAETNDLTAATEAAVAVARRRRIDGV